MGKPDDTTRGLVGRAGLREVRVGERDRACVIVIRGLNVGEMYKLNRAETVIGRGQHADVEILDDGISRRHAVVRFADDQVLIQDLGSRNGTFVNGQRLQTDPVALRDGDKIQLSSTTILKFTYADRLDESFQRRMFESALRDGLTKAFNKKYFLDRLEREFRFARRHKQPLTLVIFDIDDLKRVNDNWGHIAGDYVLSALAAEVHRLVRTEDVFARYGGEEFAIICRATDAQGALAFAERLREAVSSHQFIYENEIIPVTVSLGVATIQPHHADSQALLAAADEALYAAKKQAKNRSGLAPVPEDDPREES